MGTIYYEDPTGFVIGAIVLMVVIVVAVVRWPQFGQGLTRIIGKPGQQIHRPADTIQTSVDTLAVDRELQELAALRDKGQISEETFLARQAILARRK